MRISFSVFTRLTLIATSIVFAQCTVAQAQLPSGWKAHDWDRKRPEVVTPSESNLPLKPPSDATVLFDGTSLDAWRNNEGGPCKWVIKDGVMESVPDSGYIFTAQAFGDCQLHVEWASPARVEGNSQGRGNSGVFLMGLYEIQVLDSFDNITYADGQAGSLYGQFPPLVNASRKPGEWQSYDIVFHRAHFDKDGKLSTPARLTVLQNGVLVQDNVEAYGPTSWLQFQAESSYPDKLPLSFQDHGNPVRYRNVWIRELADNPYPRPEAAYDPVVVDLSDEQLESLTGRYGNAQITRSGHTLQLNMIGRPLDLIPHSETEFGVKYTAGKVIFLKDKEGKLSGLDFHMGGGVMHSDKN